MKARGIYLALSVRQRAVVRRHFNTEVYDALLASRPALGDSYAAARVVMSEFQPTRVVFLDESWSAPPLGKSFGAMRLKELLRASRRQNWIPSDGEETTR